MQIFKLINLRNDGGFIYRYLYNHHSILFQMYRSYIMLLINNKKKINTFYKYDAGVVIVL